VSQLSYWLMASVLLVATFGYRTYRANRTLAVRLEEARRRALQMGELHLATIEALALAIDAKDQTAQSHIRRVQVYATSIARGLGMSDTEIQGVKTAALLHDIGKLAVPEHILSKPGPLTQEEFQKIRVHPQVGAEIISAVPFPYPVAPLILSHHERWDGKGYPQGLKGQEIPLGARILSVVDYYDALTSDRPYHKAMTPEAAMALLQQEAGRALDPQVVQMFVKMAPEMEAAAETIESATPRRLSLEPQNERGVPAVGFSPESNKTSTVFEDIALAHREIYALYEIAQTMGTSLGVADTMALISSKLSNLVPFSACALFLFDEEADSLRCRFATGVEADAIGTMTVRAGQGLAGWVARNRRPLVNARPSAEFEAAGLAKSTGLQSALVAPLVFSDRFIGTLAVYSTQPDFYTDDHRRLLDRVSEQASAVIHNSIVFEQTQEDSLTDPLTGLPNTRFMFMHLTRELARAERLKAEVALLVMDLDNFKEINDSHGHHVGDRALREVATVLRSGIRPYDICVRYAGDEFIVVLSGCGADEAERKRVELQRTVDEVLFEARPGRRLPLGISIGAAIFPQDGDSYESLLATADSRMYRDKSRRKQRVEVRTAATGTDGIPVAVPVQPPALEITEIDIQRAGFGVL
jgi:diguanylate cyclase (GGDEF)-like protein/putative nucleotidyltransferase with HDIG domain